MERLELKAQGTAPRELLDAFDAFLVAFEEFKQANDGRLQQIETRLSADVVTEEKVERINAALTEQKAALDEMMLSARRPVLAAAPERRADPRSDAHKAAFDRYLRKGDAQELVGFEMKALSGLAGPEGGYVTPGELERTIGRLLKDVSPIRSLATVRSASASSYRKPVSTSGMGSGWAGETDARAETAAPQLSVIEYPAMELYAMPAATQAMLDDAQLDVEQWLAEETLAEFAAQEGKAFVTGDGIARPRGFLAYDVVADASWSWGKLGYVASGADGAFAAEDPGDALVNLAYAPKQVHRANARWVMNRRTEAAVRKLKDDHDNYLWAPGTSLGAPATLLGHPVIESEDMPDIASNSLAIAFGDFRRGYLVVDRTGIRVLRDPYSAKPFVLFYTTKRVGGGVQDFDAIKLMRFSAA